MRFGLTLNYWEYLNGSIRSYICSFGRCVALVHQLFCEWQNVTLLRQDFVCCNAACDVREVVIFYLQGKRLAPESAFVYSSQKLQYGMVKFNYDS